MYAASNFAFDLGRYSRPSLTPWFLPRIFGQKLFDHNYFCYLIKRFPDFCAPLHSYFLVWLLSPLRNCHGRSTYSRVLSVVLPVSLEAFRTVIEMAYNGMRVAASCEQSRHTLAYDPSYLNQPLHGSWCIPSSLCGFTYWAHFTVGAS
jgi:hypothetical protein